MGICLLCFKRKTGARGGGGCGGVGGVVLIVEIEICELLCDFTNGFKSSLGFSHLFLNQIKTPVKTD